MTADVQEPQEPRERAERWLAEAREALAAVALAPEAESFGRIERIADGVALVSDLPQVRLNEIVRFETGAHGFVLALEAAGLSAVLVDRSEGIDAGSRVIGTGEQVVTTVGEGLLGRIVDPLGRPLDGKGEIDSEAYWPVERDAPAIIERDLVSSPLQTGILTVDSLFAIGRGQRELIIGDRATGKTAIAVDAMIHQKYSDVVCVYVAVGQRATAVQRVIEAVHAHGAPERCIFVVASAADPAGLQWLAPFAGFTMAEWFRDRGGHALVIVDDLSKHAATHRELALLTREPPGREAFPGDVFYLHARLLERAAKLSQERGGGSLTALPIAETDAGNLAAYIPTNLISITDGQLVTSSRIFATNQRPAIDIGLSVSRVGGKAQVAALREASGRARLEYAQFLELETFSRFGGVSDARLKTQLARGERTRALFTQPRFAGLRAADQAALLVALKAGVFDSTPAPILAELRARLPIALDAALPAAVAEVDAGKPLGDPETGLGAQLVTVVRDLLAAVVSEPERT